MYWCFSGILPFLLVQGPALGSSSSSGCWIKSTNLADRMYWRTRLKERSFTFCKTNKTPHLHTSSRMEWQTHWEKHDDREILTRHSLRTMKLVNWPGQCWRYLDTFSIRMSYLLLLKEKKMLRNISPGGTKREGVGPTERTQTMNTPVYIEAFEHQKNGVLLLSWNHSCAVRLHADESMTDESLPHVVQLSSVDPVETQDLQLHSERRHGAATTPPLHNCTSRLLERASVQISL